LTGLARIDLVSLRSAAPSRLTLVGVVAVVTLLGMVVPAMGGPKAFSAASPLSIAKKALKTAKKANKKSSIAPGAIGAGKLANGAVGAADIGDGQVGNGKLADGSVTNGKLADNSVGTGKLVDHSVSTADLNGADIHGTIHGDAGAVASHSCPTSDIVLGGAQVGDVALLTFIGDTPAPAGLTFQILKVSSPGHGNIRFCNPTDAASPAFTGVGIRVLTFH
jgi:hypothetical protein